MAKPPRSIPTFLIPSDWPSMQGAYGADVAMAAKGGYRIRLKAEIGAVVLADEIKHTLEVSIDSRNQTAAVGGGIS